MYKRNKIVIASNNKGKIEEFKSIFLPYDVEVIPQSELNVSEVDEPYNTFLENCLHKARHCSKITKLPCIADDSGLCVEQLNGQPGVISAMYAGLPKDNEKNINKLLRLLSGVESRNALYYCLLVYISHEHDQCPIVADGVVNGVINEFAKGVNGFGYDKVFYLPTLGKTMAELNAEEKNQISHRAMAIKNLLVKLMTTFIAK